MYGNATIVFILLIILKGIAKETNGMERIELDDRLL